MMSENFIYVGILINVLGVSSYIFQTLKGRIQPNKVTFLLFSLAPLIAFSSQVSQGVGIQSLFTLSMALLPLLIFIASFLNKRAYWKLTLFDFSCGALSLVGLFLWYITKNGNAAIAFSIFADGLAILPTIKKAYISPESEQAWPWLAGTLNAVIALLTLRTWTFEQFGFPLYIAVATFVVFALAQFRNGKRHKN